MVEIKTANAMSAASGPGAPRLRRDFADFTRSVKGLFGSYRPERHYMRGPGPKWRAKHGASVLPSGNRRRGHDAASPGTPPLASAGVRPV